MHTGHPPMNHLLRLFASVILLSACVAEAATGKWNSQVTGTSIDYTVSQPTGTAATDQSGKPMTVVYLENLGFQKTGQVSNADNGKLTDANKHKRMYLPYFWGAFNDSFVEGASAVGFAWAVCDHPKYCDWGGDRDPYRLQHRPCSATVGSRLTADVRFHVEAHYTNYWHLCREEHRQQPTGSSSPRLVRP